MASVLLTLPHSLASLLLGKPASISSRPVGGPCGEELISLANSLQEPEVLGPAALRELKPANSLVSKFGSGPSKAGRQATGVSFEPDLLHPQLNLAMLQPQPTL